MSCGPGGKPVLGRPAAADGWRGGRRGPPGPSAPLCHRRGPLPPAGFSGQFCSLSKPLGCLTLASLGSRGEACPAEGPCGGEQGGLYALRSQPRLRPQTARLSWIERAHGTTWLSGAWRPGLERTEAQRGLEQLWALMARGRAPLGTGASSCPTWRVRRMKPEKVLGVGGGPRCPHAQTCLQPREAGSPPADSPRFLRRGAHPCRGGGEGARTLCPDVRLCTYVSGQLSPCVWNF